MVIFLTCLLQPSQSCNPKRHQFRDIQYFLSKQCDKGIPYQSHVNGISEAG